MLRIYILWNPTPYPFIHHFSRKRYPFRISSIDKWYPSHIPCLKLCISFNCAKAPSFKKKSIPKKNIFLRLYKHKIKLLPLFGWFYRPKLQMPYPFVDFNEYIPEAWKRYPFRAKPPRIAHYREYPPGLTVHFFLEMHCLIEARNLWDFDTSIMRFCALLSKSLYNSKVRFYKWNSLQENDGEKTKERNCSQC